MSEFYKPQRTKNLFNPQSDQPFKLSRSKIENFVKCPRCFYVDRRLGITPPPGFPFTLNSAVDSLLKREFDSYRERQKPHPLMKQFAIEAVPHAHEDLELWRDSLRGGLQFHHSGTNLIITGGIDDVWRDNDGWLIVVDYKATSKRGKVNLDADWQIGYKRQMEIYQWLLRQMGHMVSDTGYFVYCNGDAAAPTFAQQLRFDIEILPYSGNDSWIDDLLYQIKTTLMKNEIPEPTVSCDHCAYNSALKSIGIS